MATFTWTPDENATEDHEPRVRKVAFGDGYEQRGADGINSDLARFPGLSFSGRSTAESDAIWAFLKARGGSESFDWTPPSGTAGKFVCPKYSRQIKGTTAPITCDFYQVPA